MLLSTNLKDIFPNRSSILPFYHLYTQNKEEKVSIGKIVQTTEPFRIYFADDDKDDRELFKEALENTEQDIRLSLFNDGVDLIKKFKSSESIPDLVVLDLNMPNKNGIDCLNFIRKNKRLKNIPVAIYSTSSSAKDIEESFVKGANIYISKPSSFSELKELANKLIEMDWNQHQPKTSREKFIFTRKNS